MAVFYKKRDEAGTVYTENDNDKFRFHNDIELLTSNVNFVMGTDDQKNNMTFKYPGDLGGGGIYINSPQSAILEIDSSGSVHIPDVVIDALDVDSITSSNPEILVGKCLLVNDCIKCTDVVGDTTITSSAQFHARSNTSTGLLIEADVNSTSISDISRLQMKQLGSTRALEITIGSANIAKFFHGSTADIISGKYEFYTCQFGNVPDHFNTLGPATLLFSINNSAITAYKPFDLNSNSITSVNNIALNSLSAITSNISVSSNLLINGTSKKLQITSGNDLQLSGLAAGTTSDILNVESSGNVRTRDYFSIASPQYAEVLAAQATTSSTYQNIINTSTTDLEAGTYQFSLFAEVMGDTGSTEIVLQTTFGSHVKENYIFFNTPSEWIPITINFIQITSGVNALTYKIASADGVNNVSTKNSQMFVRRIV